MEYVIEITKFIQVQVSLYSRARVRARAPILFTHKLIKILSQ